MATWLEDIIEAYEAIGGSGPYSQLYPEIEKLRPYRSKEWKATVRRTIEVNSSDSENYTGGPDIFYSVEGIGRGVWGLRSRLGSTPSASDIEPPDPSDEVGDPGPGEKSPHRRQTEIYRILRDTALARKLKVLHDDRCQICESVLEAHGRRYSEAHHVIPLGTPHNGPDTPGNIIVLCPNHHALFDLGAIHLDKDAIRVVDGHSIDVESVRYHNEVIVPADAQSLAN